MDTVIILFFQGEEMLKFNLTFLKKHFTTKFTDVNTAERQMESESDTVEKLNRFYLWTVSKINLHFKIIQRHGGVVLNTVIFGQRF